MPSAQVGQAAINVAGRRELFVDRALIETLGGKAELRLHRPTEREIALPFDKPWEGNASGYATVIQDGDRYRLYYRGHRYLLDAPPLRQAQPEVVCYAESTDGLHWERPNLGLYDWPATQDNSGNKQNNIIWRGTPETHNFAPFKDANPACRPDERYKAIAGTDASKGLWTFKSADGIRWSRLSSAAVVTKGAFDSHNTAFWDVEKRRYTMYVRYFSEGGFKGLRSIGVCYSQDFKAWSEPVGLDYGASPPQQMYTNQIGPYYRAPHLLFGFPTRFVARPLTPHAERLEPVDTRAKFAASIKNSGAYTGAEITDGLFMASRDGRSFHRWDEAFLRPGPESAGRWIYGDNYQSYGLFESKSSPKEISFLATEGAWRDASHRMRRYSLRLDGFVSVNAPLSGGELITKPLVFSGKRLSLNYATSAAGSLRVELQNGAGLPLRGFSLADADELFGDSVDQQAMWRGSADVAALQGKTVRLRFTLKDADVFAFQFRD